MERANAWDEINVHRLLLYDNILQDLNHKN